MPIVQQPQHGPETRSNPELSIKLMALAIDILSERNTAPIEAKVESLLSRYKGRVDQLMTRLENSLPKYLTQLKAAVAEVKDMPDEHGLPQQHGAQHMDPQARQAAVTVTPEQAKKAVPEVTEVCASVDVKEEFKGDPEASELYEDRETKRPLGERMPSNDHGQMRDRVLASTDALPGQDLNSWFTPGIPSGRMSSAEADLLDGLYE